MTGRAHHRGLAAVALFKLVKAGLLLLAGVGLLELMHADLATVCAHLLETLHLNADSRLVHSIVLRVDALQPHTVLVASLISLMYAALFFTERIGLWKEWAWAAYLTVISTGAFLPFELYEVLERVSVLRAGVVLLNAVILWYLIRQLQRQTLRSRAAPARLASSAPHEKRPV
ncbi:MAG TPA: DUF2127 domain-containing protein [Nitrospira sp.]|nr:DUF2127 domain-containing protein [Nitrospira sp.]